MNLAFVPAVEADRTFFVHVHHTAYRNAIESMFGWDQVLQDGFANDAFDKGGTHIIYLEGIRIGVVGWQQFPDYLWLKEIFLLPEYQRKGIGQKIVMLSKEKAKALNKPLRLRTLKTNPGAKRLYERCGLVVTEATDILWNLEWMPETQN